MVNQCIVEQSMDESTSGALIAASEADLVVGVPHTPLASTQCGLTKAWEEYLEQLYPPRDCRWFLIQALGKLARVPSSMTRSETICAGGTNAKTPARDGVMLTGAPSRTIAKHVGHTPYQ